MTGATAYAKATTTLPSTKPVLRIFQDAVRAASLRLEPDGKARIFHMAEKLVQQAMTGDVACLREVADRLDGKAQVIGDDGAVSVSFVVRLPQQADPSEWAKAITGHAEAFAAPAPVIENQPIEPMPLSLEMGGLDGRSTQSVTDLEPVAEVSPRLVAPDPLVPGTPPVVSDRTEQ